MKESQFPANRPHAANFSQTHCLYTRGHFRFYLFSESVNTPTFAFQTNLPAPATRAWISPRKAKRIVMDFRLPAYHQDTGQDTGQHIGQDTGDYPFIPHEYTHQLMREQGATYYTYPFGDFLQQELKRRRFGYSQHLVDLPEALTLEARETATRITLLYMLQGDAEFRQTGQPSVPVAQGEHQSLYLPMKDSCQVHLPKGRHLIAQLFIPLTMIRFLAVHHPLCRHVTDAIDQKTAGCIPLYRKLITPPIFRALTDLRCCPSQEPARSLRLRAKTFDLMYEHLRAPDGPDRRQEAVIAQMHAIGDYITQNLQNHHTARELGEHFGLSERNIRRLFKQVFQQSILQFTLDQRMRKAMKLVRETDMSMLAICLELGYDDLSDFSRIFIKHYGSSPSSFKKK